MKPLFLSANFFLYYTDQSIILIVFINFYYYSCLLDEVGLDVSHHVSKFMAGADLGDRMLGGNPLLVGKMVENGWLGRKVGKGFYLYPKDAKKGAPKQLNPEVVAMLKKEFGDKPSTLSEEDIQWRMASRFMNEAAFCLQDGIIRSPVDGK